jgi:hypothetical protein
MSSSICGRDLIAIVILQPRAKPSKSAKIPNAMDHAEMLTTAIGRGFSSGELPLHKLKGKSL